MTAKAKQFFPGEIWPDDKGVHINAHGGGILFREGVYYWFGEHKIAGEAGNPTTGTNPKNDMGPEKTFGGQSTFILPIQGIGDAFIAMFDMWRPENAIDGRYLWLPMVFGNDQFTIPWESNWDVGFLCR